MILVGGPDPQWEYVSNLWVSFESGNDDPLSGCCGSPLFDSQGEAYVFFRYFRTTAPRRHIVLVLIPFSMQITFCPPYRVQIVETLVFWSVSSITKEVPERYKVPVFTFLFLSLDCFFCADGGK